MALEGIAIRKPNVTARQSGGNPQALPACGEVRIVLNRRLETRSDHVLHPALAATASGIAIDCDVRERRRPARTWAN